MFFLFFFLFRAGGPEIPVLAGGQLLLIMEQKMRRSTSNFDSLLQPMQCSRALGTPQSRKCAINNFWTRNSAGLLG